MKKIRTALLLLLATAFLFVGGIAITYRTDILSYYKLKNIEFSDNQLYAVAYLGYNQIDDLDFYKEKYLAQDNIPQHHFSKGEYYLIIPRYSDMRVSLYKNTIVPMDKNLVYVNNESKPFIICCNESDIFSNATISFTYKGATAEFSPYFSLKDGTLMIGEAGVNITNQQ